MVRKIWEAQVKKGAYPPRILWLVGIITVLIIGGILLSKGIFLAGNILRFQSGLFAMMRNLYLLKYVPELKPDSSWALILLVGFLTSFHCIGMCGGIVLAQGLNGWAPEGAIHRRGWLKPSIRYNLGRVFSYTLSGGLTGGLGRLAHLSGNWQGVVPMIGGLFMVVIGLNILGLFPVLRLLNPRMPAFLTRKLNAGHHHGALAIGLLSGLLPCGPLQAAQLYALSTGSVFAGACVMFSFALGTVPLLTGFGVMSFFLSQRFTKLILKISAVLVIVLGVGMLGRGLTAAGISFDINPAQETGAGGLAVLHGEYQTVETTLQPDKYRPIIVQKGIPVRWTIKAAAKDLNGCNNALVIPKYHLRKNLTTGDNIIQFTPVEEGAIAYTCWMGMIKSKITVVADLKKFRLKWLNVVNKERRNEK